MANSFSSPTVTLTLPHPASVQTRVLLRSAGNWCVLPDGMVAARKVVVAEMGRDWFWVR